MRDQRQHVSDFVREIYANKATLADIKELFSNNVGNRLERFEPLNRKQSLQ